MGNFPLQPSAIDTGFIAATDLEEMNKYAKLQTRIDRKIYCYTRNMQCAAI